MRTASRHFCFYDRIIIFLLYWVTLQDIVLGVIYRITHSKMLVTPLFYSKDALLIVLLIAALARFRPNHKIEVAEYIFLALLAVIGAVSFLTSQLSASSIAAALRGLLLCPAFLLIGYNIRNKEVMKEYIINNYFRYLFFLSIIGIADCAIDHFIGTQAFWTGFVGIGDFYADIKHSSGIYRNLPSNFYGYSSAGFFTRKRLVSIWGNPLTSGYSLLIPGLYFVNRTLDILKARGQNKSKTAIKTIIYTFVFIVAVFLTFTRAIILGMFLGIGLLVMYRNRKRMSNVVALLLFLLICGVLYIAVADFTRIQRILVDGSTLAHLRALDRSSDLMSFWGNGIGAVGLLGGQVATESVYYSIWGQIGFPGLIIFTAILLIAIRSSYKGVCRHGDFPLIVGISWIVLLFTGFISEQLTAYTTIASAYIMLGMVQSKDRRWDTAASRPVDMLLTKREYVDCVR